MSNPTERLKVLQQLGRTYRAFLSAYEKEVGHFMPRWRVMLHLHTEGKPCPQKQVGDASHMDPGALSRQLSTLESLGWIRRHTDQQDKRVTNVELTARGRQEVETALPKRAAFVERVFGDISDRQLKQLTDSLLLLEGRFAATRSETAPQEDTVESD